jgi:hypothetical protein
VRKDVSIGFDSLALATSRLKTEMLAEKLQHMILKTISDLARHDSERISHGDHDDWSLTPRRREAIANQHSRISTIDRRNPEID